MTKPSNREGLNGVVEGAKGRIKRAAGALTDDERLEREGEAQEAKGAAEREAAKHELQADLERAKARGAEVDERTHQDR